MSEPYGRIKREKKHHIPKTPYARPTERTRNEVNKDIEEQNKGISFWGALSTRLKQFTESVFTYTPPQTTTQNNHESSDSEEEGLKINTRRSSPQAPPSFASGQGQPKQIDLETVIYETRQISRRDYEHFRKMLAERVTDPEFNVEENFLSQGNSSVRKENNQVETYQVRNSEILPTGTIVTPAKPIPVHTGRVTPVDIVGSILHRGRGFSPRLQQSSTGLPSHLFASPGTPSFSTANSQLNGLKRQRPSPKPDGVKAPTPSLPLSTSLLEDDNQPPTKQRRTLYDKDATPIAAASETAKRILQALNQISSPLGETIPGYTFGTDRRLPSSGSKPRRVAGISAKITRPTPPIRRPLNTDFFVNLEEGAPPVETLGIPEKKTLGFNKRIKMDTVNTSVQEKKTPITASSLKFETKQAQDVYESIDTEENEKIPIFSNNIVSSSEIIPSFQFSKSKTTFEVDEISHEDTSKQKDIEIKSDKNPLSITPMIPPTPLNTPTHSLTEIPPTFELFKDKEKEKKNFGFDTFATSNELKSPLFDKVDDGVLKVSSFDTKSKDKESETKNIFGFESMDSKTNFVFTSSPAKDDKPAIFGNFGQNVTAAPSFNFLASKKDTVKTTEELKVEIGKKEDKKEEKKEEKKQEKEERKVEATEEKKNLFFGNNVTTVFNFGSDKSSSFAGFSDSSRIKSSTLEISEDSKEKSVDKAEEKSENAETAPETKAAVHSLLTIPSFSTFQKLSEKKDEAASEPKSFFNFGGAGSDKSAGAPTIDVQPPSQEKQETIVGTTPEESPKISIETPTTFGTATTTLNTTPTTFGATTTTQNATTTTFGTTATLNTNPITFGTATTTLNTTPTTFGATTTSTQNTTPATFGTSLTATPTFSFTKVDSTPVVSTPVVSAPVVSTFGETPSQSDTSMDHEEKPAFPTFGSSAPAFGTFGGSTPQTPTFSFGSTVPSVENSKTDTPTFGGFGQTSTFGSTAPASGPFSFSAPSVPNTFSFGNNSSSNSDFVFGGTPSIPTTSTGVTFGQAQTGNGFLFGSQNPPSASFGQPLGQPSFGEQQNQPTFFPPPQTSFNFSNPGGGMFNQPQFPVGDQQQSGMFTIGSQSTNQGRRKVKPKKK